LLLLINNDCACVTWTHKYEVFQSFVKFFCFIQNQFGKNIKRIRSNNSTGYVNHKFFNFLSYNGIVHELTCVNTLHQKQSCRKEESPYSKGS